MQRSSIRKREGFLIIKIAIMKKQRNYLRKWLIFRYKLNRKRNEFRHFMTIFKMSLR